jgi:hypothetical protein
MTAGKLPLPGFASRCHGQVLSVGGVLLLVRLDNSEAVHRRLATAVAKQSSEESGRTVGGGSETGGGLLW